MRYIKRFVIGITVFVLVFSPAFTIAQQEAEMPACDEGQVGVVRDISDEFETAWVTLKSVKSAEELREVFITLNGLQTLWWAEQAATLPSCSPAVEAGILYSRLIDETLLGASLMLAANLVASDQNQDPIITQDDLFRRGWDHIQAAIPMRERLRALLPDSEQRPGPDQYYSCIQAGGSVFTCWYLIFW